LDGTSEVVQFACCGIEAFTDRDGLLTTLEYDALGRVKAECRWHETNTPMCIYYSYDAANHVVQAGRKGGGEGGESTQSAAGFDSAGRLRFQTNALGGGAQFSYSVLTQGGHARTEHLPNGGTRIETFNRDGTPAMLTGTAVHGVAYTYEVARDGSLRTKETKLEQEDAPTCEWLCETVDMLGRGKSTSYPDGAKSETFYNAKGQLWMEKDPDGGMTFYEHNPNGLVENVAVRTREDLSEAIDFKGSDRIIGTSRDVVYNPTINGNVRRMRVFSWENNGSAQSNLLYMIETSVDGLERWHTVYENGRAVSSHVRRSYGEGTKEELEFSPTNSTTRKVYVRGRLERIETLGDLDRVVSTVSYRYDSLNRVATVTDSRGGDEAKSLGKKAQRTTDYVYNLAGLPCRIVIRGDKGEESTTTFSYDESGQETQVNVGGKNRLTREYILTGEIKTVSGEGLPLSEYTYDYAGRTKSVRTWRKLSDPQSSSVVTWDYDPRRGWLIRKTFEDQPGPTYEYSPGGKLRKRIWARQISADCATRIATEYKYNSAGDLVDIAYNDGLTANLHYDYDRRGRLRCVTQGNCSAWLEYNALGEVASEGRLEDSMTRWSLRNAFDDRLRRSEMRMLGSGTEFLTRYKYDAASRLESTSSGELIAEYSYNEGFPLVEGVVCKSNMTPMLTRSYSYKGDRSLLSLEQRGGAWVMPQTLSYDSLNRPVTWVSPGGFRWSYDYGPGGELTTAQRSSDGHSSSRGWRFDYQFDQKGDRVGLQISTSRDNLATRDLHDEQIGNSLAADCADCHFDADGNLTNDGRWSFTWDAENRLVKMEALNDSAPVQMLEFTYDWLGRRTEKRVFRVPGSAEISRFVYDGWNLVAVLDASWKMRQAFTWGPDQSGTSFGAGGAGGLLWFQEATAGGTNTAYFPI
jgi:hypothetical protein